MRGRIPHERMQSANSDGRGDYGRIAGEDEWKILEGMPRDLTRFLMME